MPRNYFGAGARRVVLSATVAAAVIGPFATVALYQAGRQVAGPPPRPSLVGRVTPDFQVELIWACESEQPVNKWEYQRKLGLGEYSPWTVVSEDGAARSAVLGAPNNGMAAAFRVRASAGSTVGPPSNEVWVDVLSVRSFSVLSSIAERLTPETSPYCDSPIELGVFRFPHDTYVAPPTAVPTANVNSAAPTARTLANILKHLRTTSDRLIVEGNASFPGSRAYNLGLAEKRAEAIAQLLLQSVPRQPPTRLHVVVRGEGAGTLADPQHLHRNVRVLACSETTTGPRRAG